MIIVGTNKLIQGKLWHMANTQYLPVIITITNCGVLTEDKEIDILLSSIMMEAVKFKEVKNNVLKMSRQTHTNVGFQPILGHFSIRSFVACRLPCWSPGLGYQHHPQALPVGLPCLWVQLNEFNLLTMHFPRALL